MTVLGNQPLIYVLETSGRWSAGIAELMPRAKVTRSLSLEHLLKDCLENPFRAAIVESQRLSADPNCKNFMLDQVDTNRCRFFAVGPGAANLHLPLSALGFAATIESYADIQRLCKLLRRHFECLESPDLSLEDRISAGLPWG